MSTTFDERPANDAAETRVDASCSQFDADGSNCRSRMSSTSCRRTISTRTNFLPGLGLR